MLRRCLDPTLSRMARKWKENVALVGVVKVLWMAFVFVSSGLPRELASAPANLKFLGELFRCYMPFPSAKYSLHVHGILGSSQWRRQGF